MLMLTIKRSEKVHIGDDVTIQVSVINESSVRVAFDAPRSVIIQRGAVREKLQCNREVPQQTQEQNHHLPQGSDAA